MHSLMPPPSNLERWHDQARQRGPLLSRVLAGPAKRTGEIVSENLQAEAHLDPTAFGDVLSTFDETGPFDQPDPSTPGRTRFDTAMQPLARQGGPAEVARALARMINARAIVTRDPRVFNGSRYPTAAEWERFLRTIARLQAAQPDIVDGFLAGLRMARGETCWATELDRLSDVDRSGTARDFGRIHDRLGLDWPEVAVSREVPPAAGGPAVLAVILHYDRKDVSGVAVPTVADAGWDGLFRPSPRGARIGTTLDRRGADGLPEVVHTSRDCSCLRDRTFGDSGPITS